MTTKTLTPEYLDLCIRVEKLDPEAAKYMWDEAPKLDRFDGSASMISSAFVFSETPQGHEYWWSLQNRLANEEDEAPKCA